MPTYEYRCPSGHEFELFQRMSDEPRASCPTCGDEATRLLSAGAGFLFKGDGFYITDYRSDAYRAAAKKESGTGAASAPSGGDGGAPAASGSGGTSSSGSSGSSAPSASPAPAPGPAAPSPSKSPAGKPASSSSSD